MGRGWIYGEDGRTVGPITSEQLAGLFRAGRLTPDSLIAAEGDPDLAPARERVPDLVRSPPPVTPADVTAPRRGWTDTAPHPWRRYFARFMDNLLIGAVLWMALSMTAYLIDPVAADRALGWLAQPVAADGPFGLFAPMLAVVLDSVLTLLLVLPTQVLMIGLTGLSPGKWVFGVRILRDGKPIGVPAALVREARVWVQGFALGVPFVSLATLLLSYVRLTEKGAAPWDERPGVVVVHRRVNVLQVGLTLIFIPALIAASVGLKLLGTAQ